MVYSNVRDMQVQKVFARLGKVIKFWLFGTLLLLCSAQTNDLTANLLNLYI